MHGTIPVKDLYELPIEKRLARTILLSLYYGVIDLGELGVNYGLNLNEHFSSEIKFLLENEYMTMENGILRLTTTGSPHINGIIALFHSPRSQSLLLASIGK